MEAQIGILIIVVAVSLIILKKSFDRGILPWATIFVIGLIGFLFFGTLGLIRGLVVGVVLNIVLSFVPEVFNIGLLRKKDRELIAKGFLSEYRDKIIMLKSDRGWADKLSSDEKSISVFSKYINKIYLEANKLENPTKRHPQDLEVAGIRENFIKGGENWINSFNNSKEKEVMKLFVEFCENVIYDNPERVGGIRAHR